MFKKGQGATEYLTILAVVIIVALIVVVAMGGIPGIGTGAKSRTSDSFWQTADIAIVNYAAFAGTSDLNVTLRNNLRNSITLTTVSIGGTTLSCSPSSIAAGQTSSCFHTTGASCTAGDAFSYAVSVAYTDTETNAGYTFTGEGHKLEGKCAN